jgi:uncharacterized protein with ParB-like and HNH nuclease domain
MAEIKQKATQAEFVKWFGPVLDALRQLGGTGKPKDVVALIAKNENVPDDVLIEKLKSGSLRFPNQVAFARQYLVWEGLLENNVHGLWELSPIGYKTYLDVIEARKIFLKWVDFHQKNREAKNKNGVEKNQDSDGTGNGEEYDSGVEDEFEEFQPFDPEKISIETKPMAMETCLKRLVQGTIILAPDFQRKEVWTIQQKCRLIESIMLKIPIPMFYVSQDEKGVYSVVDGLQRLSTIRSFILGDKYLDTKDERYKGEGFKLKDLEFWGDRYDGDTFNKLPVNIQNRISETIFTFTIINPTTPEEVKRNVFKRINTGGAPLTAQEIRHALYIGESTKLLSRLSERIEFYEATDFSVKSNRMIDRELILRFLSFTVRSYVNYSKKNDMDAFLSDTMRIINIMPDLTGKEEKKLFSDETVKKSDIIIRDVTVLEELFIIGMIRTKSIFGAHTFRKSYGNKRKSQVNKALFEIWSVLLSKLSENEFDNLQKNKMTFLNQYYPYLEEPVFIYSISRDSWKFSGVKYRYETLTNLLNKFIND